jgi:predicted lipid-binding transport protein (Tim44 family)
MESRDIPEEDQRPADRGMDAVADHAEHVVPFGGGMVREMHEVAEHLGKEVERETKEFDTFDHAIHEQPSAVGAGVDLTPIKAVEPDFDPFNFRTLARETFIKVRQARGTQATHAGDGLLSPSMERELNDVIDGDVAAHRHHVLSQLEVIDATIVSASFEAGREKLGMRFVVGAEEIERDGATEAIVSDDHLVHRWAEQWQFERDPSLDPSATDEQHILSFGPDRWLVAHRGWVVTDIRRLD